MNNTDIVGRYYVSYRLVYARLNNYSDEGIVVGLLYESNGAVRGKFVSSQRLYQVLPSLVDMELTEQIEYSINLLRELLTSLQPRLDEIDIPASLIRLGKRYDGVCEDEDGFVNDVLKCSSSLYSSYTVSVRRSVASVSQKEVEDAIKKELVRLNPFQAKSLIGSTRKILIDKKLVGIPFFGNRTIGAPISMMKVDPYDALSSAEHWLVRLNYARRVLESEGVEKFPYLYLYAPYVENEKYSKLSKSVTSEIEIVGKSMDVGIVTAASIDVLAGAVYDNEQIVWH